MTYDRDIKWARHLLHALAVGNLWACMLNLWQHNWFIAIACGIWFINVLVMVGMGRRQQELRDSARLLEAAMRRHVETGQF